MSDQPLVTITAQQMFDMLTRMEKVTDKLVDSLSNLKEIAEDHEDRIRVIESRADTVKRLDMLEERVTQHDMAFTKHGERLGKVEVKTDTKYNPLIVSTVLTLVINIIAFFIK